MPRLRFPGFKGAWEEQCLFDIGAIVTGSTPPTSDRSNYGIDYPFCSPSDVGGQRYISETERYVSDKGYRLGRPIPPGGIIVTCIGIIGKLGIASRAMIANQQINAVIVKPEFDVEFIFDAIGHIVPTLRTRASQQTLPILSKLEFGKVCIRIPPIPEQKKLGHFLSLLDSRIAAQRKLVELLKKHKRGVIEQFFGRRLDMGKDAEKWDVVELRDLFSKVARRNRDGKVKNVITNSAEFGLIPQRDFFDKSIAVDGNTDGYYVIRTGDFVYNPRKSTAAPFGPFNRYMGKEDGIISPLYTCLVPKGNANPEYLAWYFRSTAWHRYVYDNGSQGARHDRVNMTDDLLFGIPVLLPPIAVQERIADGLNAIDARWSSANKVLAHLEKMKRGLLQQLFA